MTERREPLKRPIIHNRKESDRELLARALNVLHAIGGAYKARELLKRPHLTEPLRAGLLAKALTDETIETLALDTWETIVTEMQKK